MQDVGGSIPPSSMKNLRGFNSGVECLLCNHFAAQRFFDARHELVGDNFLLSIICLLSKSKKS